MRFLRVNTKTYMGKELSEYISAVRKRDDLQDEEDWKRSQYDAEDIKPPKAYISRVGIIPDDIKSYVEISSIEETYRNPDDPQFDCLDVTMENGMQISVMGTLEEFEQKLQEFYNKKDENNIALS